MEAHAFKENAFTLEKMYADAFKAKSKVEKFWFSISLYEDNKINFKSVWCWWRFCWFLWTWPLHPNSCWLVAVEEICSKIIVAWSRVFDKWVVQSVTNWRELSARVRPALVVWDTFLCWKLGTCWSDSSNESKEQRVKNEFLIGFRWVGSKDRALLGRGLFAQTSFSPDFWNISIL